ncbi:TPA: hypothetical protein ACY3OY_002417, partial [Citrobacter freundii]
RMVNAPKSSWAIDVLHVERGKTEFTGCGGLDVYGGLVYACLARCIRFADFSPPCGAVFFGISPWYGQRGQWHQACCQQSCCKTVETHTFTQ